MSYRIPALVPSMAAALVLLLAGDGHAFSEHLSVQGVLKTSAGANVGDGDHAVKFRLYSAEGDAIADAVWSDDVTVTTRGGLFTARLGVGNPFNMPFDGDLWLGIHVVGEPGEMSPRMQLGATAYAINANRVGGRTAAQLVSDAVNAIAPSLFSGDYDDLTNKPAIPGAASEITVAAPVAGAHVQGALEALNTRVAALEQGGGGNGGGNGGGEIVDGGLVTPESGSDPSTCDAAHAGHIYFNNETGEFRGCDGQTWVNVGGGPTDASGQPGRSCKAILESGGSVGDGIYLIDPDGEGGLDPVQAYCDMTRDGGGWTLGVKTWSGDLLNGKSAAVGDVTRGITHKGEPFKLSDEVIRALIGPRQNFDVLADQSGWNSSYSFGNNEYVVVRNYTGRWRFDGPVDDSTTQTTMHSYRASDGHEAWSGNLRCGTSTSAAGWGINCLDVLAGNNPAGGSGCATQLNPGYSTNGSWHHFYMKRSDTDTYLYFCNGPQHSSGHDMNHRFWFRERTPSAGALGSQGNPALSCLDLLEQVPGTPDGDYFIDPDGDGPATPSQARCDMTRDGGGWTLFLKHWYQAPYMHGATGHRGFVAYADDARGHGYKLSDEVVRGIIGPAQNFDYLADQVGFYSAGSSGAHEYVIVENYTGYWRFDALVEPSRTKTLFTSYRASDDAIAWQGNLRCGNTHGGGRGINCYDLLEGSNPIGGPGCDTNLGITGGHVTWHYLYMSEHNSDSYMFLCNGNQASSNSSTMNHRWWVRERRPEALLALGQSGNPARSCKDLLIQAPGTPSGYYYADPDGDGPLAPTEVYCEMERDGGGWTMVVKNWHGSGVHGVAGSHGSVNEALSHKGIGYKLSDAFIRGIIGSRQKFDVMGDQSRWNSAYSNGNYEYAILRNYTGYFRFDQRMGESTTPTVLQSYRIADGALAWTGDFRCGDVGGVGINCNAIVSGPNPGGGSGCDIRLSPGNYATNPSWHHFYMSDTNSDTYLYLCNGPQHSSSQDMNHRWWVRESEPPKAGALGTEGNPGRSCLDIHTQDPALPSGTYFIEPDGDGPATPAYVECDMVRDGGGWTLGLKTWYNTSMHAVPRSFGRVGDALGLLGYPYKLDDETIRGVIGPDQNFDVLADQAGFNSTYSNGNFEYVILRNYTGYWRYDINTAPSSTTTVFQSYRAADDALAWTGNFECGNLGSAYRGINCSTVLSNNPQGGAGCDINMGKQSSSNWHNFYMAHSNSDSYLYICNGPQHSSGHNMNHRFWFRER